jgi:hypothetical protein
MNKVVRDGKVAVLISPGFGAGWYTWNRDHKDLLFHPRLVELVEQKRHDAITDELCEELVGSDYICTGGAHDLVIEWLPEGTAFRVEEYDGSETLTVFEDLHLIA